MGTEISSRLGIIVTPEREKLVDFSIPTVSGLKLVVVTGKNAPRVSSFDDLSGKKYMSIESPSRTTSCRTRAGS